MFLLGEAGHELNHADSHRDDSGFLLGSVLHGLDLSATHPIRAVFVDGFLDVGGKIFIASLKLLVVPLVFVSLVCGASNLSDGAAMGRVGGKPSASSC